MAPRSPSCGVSDVDEAPALKAALKRHRTLLRGLTQVQRAVVGRAPLEEIVGVVVRTADEVLDDERAALFLLDPDDPTVLVEAGSAGVVTSRERWPVTEGLAGFAVAQARLVVADDYRAHPAAMQQRVEAGTHRAMAAPVFEGSRVIGCLFVSSQHIARPYEIDERDVLVALAQHVSLALHDARMDAAMAHQALHDGLTDLPNRVLFTDRLRHAVARSARSGTEVAVLFCDLDRFKTVNDSLGHLAGDDLLVALAARLSGCLRDCDTAARLGGDEFAVILEDVTCEEDAEALAHRIVEAVAQPLQLEEHEVVPSVSVGVAVGRGPAGELLRDADLAMYRAKAAGGGGVARFTPDMAELVQDRIVLEADLRRAVAGDELEVHFQPLVQLRSRTLTGFEALVRWRHPTRGLLGPEQFLDAAQEIGALPAITRLVLDAACATAAELREHHPDAGLDTMTVNVAASALTDPVLVQDVRSALDAHGLPAGVLVLELVESERIEDSDDVVEALGALKATGVRLALDDFGTGWSSMRYLRRFPVDVLKIAKPFVDGLGGATELGADAGIAAAIIELAGALGLDVIAEGVEEHAQAARLRSLGCGIAQGFLFAPALDRVSLERLLENPPAAAAWRLGPVPLKDFGLVRIG